MWDAFKTTSAIAFCKNITSSHIIGANTIRENLKNQNIKCISFWCLSNTF